MRSGNTALLLLALSVPRVCASLETQAAVAALRGCLQLSEGRERATPTKDSAQLACAVEQVSVVSVLHAAGTSLTCSSAHSSMVDENTSNKLRVPARPKMRTTSPKSDRVCLDADRPMQ